LHPAGLGGRIENIVLCAVFKIVLVRVERRVVRILEHVVALGLVPIQWLLRTPCAIGRVVRGPIRVGTAATGDLSWGQRGGRHGTGHVAPETHHVHLLRARVRPVYPEPRANTPAFRALRHLRWDLEVRVQRPHARLVHAEYSDVLRFDLCDVRVVCDAQRAAAEIVDAVGVEFRRGLAGTRIVWVVEIPQVATGTRFPIARRVFVT